MDNGASVPDPALVSDPAPTGQSPSGFDPSRGEIWSAALLFWTKKGGARLCHGMGFSENEAVGNAMAGVEQGDELAGKLTGLLTAQGIETGTDETRSGSVSEADESPVAESDAPNSSRPTQEDRSDGE